MEIKSRKIQWTLKNVIKETLLKYDTFNRIISPSFRINVTDDLYDTWYLLAYLKDDALGIYLYKDKDNYPKERYLVECNFSAKNVELDTLKDFSNEFDDSGYGYQNLATLQELFDDENPSVNDNSFIINVNITIKPCPNNFNSTSVFPKRLSKPSFLMSIREGSYFHNEDPTLNDVIKNIANEMEDASLNDFELICKIFEAAQKFELLKLQLECIDALAESIDSKNVFDVLKMAIEHEFIKLEDKALSFISMHYYSLKTTAKWRKVTVPLKAKILDAISGNNETIILETTLS